MSELYETNMTTHRPWKKVLSVVLSVILTFGTLVTLTVGSSRLQDWLGIKSMLSAYAAEYVDTAGARTGDGSLFYSCYPSAKPCTGRCKPGPKFKNRTGDGSL